MSFCLPHTCTFQKRFLSNAVQGLSRAQPAHAGHRHSQSAPLPFLPGRALSSVCDGPELRHRQTDRRSEFIYKIIVSRLFLKGCKLSSKDHALSRVVFVVFLSSLALFCSVLFWFFFFFTQCVSQLFPVVLQFEDGTHLKRRQIPLLDVRWGCRSHYCKHFTTSKNTSFQ
jgi:hypothetical protein